MARTRRIFFLVVWVTTIYFLFEGCSNRAYLQRKTIKVIQTPVDLSQDLREVEICLLKRDNGGSVISIVDLSMDEKYYYETNQYISRAVISQDRKYLVVNQPLYIKGHLVDWLWRINRMNNQKVKIVGWESDVFEIVISNPSVTPDSQYVLFSIKWLNTGEEGVGKVEIDGSNLMFLETNKRLVEGPESSPDNSLILVRCGGLKEEFYHVGLCLLDKNGKFISYLADEGDMYGNYYFLPDGHRIVYSEHTFGGLFSPTIQDQNHLFLIDLNTGDKKIVLNWNITILGFSPDGEQIIFMENTKLVGHNLIYIMNIDGTNMRHLRYFDDFLEKWYADAY